MLTFFPRKILFPSKNLLSLPGVNLETCWFDGLSRFNVYRTQTNRHSSKVHISTRCLVSLACNISLALFLIGLITIHLQVQSSIIFLIDIFAIIFNSLSQGSLVGLLLSIIQLTPPPPFPSHSIHQLYKVFQDLLNILLENESTRLCIYFLVFMDCLAKKGVAKGPLFGVPDIHGP